MAVAQPLAHLRPQGGNPRAGFELELERIRLRAMWAIDRASEQPSSRLQAELTRLERAVGEARASGLSRLQLLAQRLELAPDEAEFLCFVAAVASDPLLTPHVLTLAGSDVRRGASLSLFAQVAGLEPPRARALALALSSRHPLVAGRLLVPVDSHDLSALTPFMVPRRVLAFLAGVDEVDEAVAAAGGVVSVPDTVCLDARQTAVAQVLAQALRDPETHIAVVLQGAVGSGRRTLTARAATLPVVALDLCRLGRSPGALDEALGALRRECVLRGALAMVCGLEEVRGPEADAAQRRRILGAHLDLMPGPVVLSSSEASFELETTRRLLRLQLPAPEVPTRRALWRAAFGDAAPELSDDLDRAAMRYTLGAGGIREAAAAARLIGRASGRPVDSALLADGVRATIQERLGTLAQHIRVRHSWDDLVLPEDTREQVDFLVSRARHAYRVLAEWGFSKNIASGLAALFSGPPGTGKTMVAGLVARELDLDLYRVDLSQIISKWVGETEKGLSRVFDAADTGHVLLLFDEADSLFAKRTEVKGASERYANLEVNYLLQRIESFAGLAILTTNLDTNIDPAFRRRLTTHIRFPQPEEDERLVLWRTQIPKEAPVDSTLDLGKLAKSYPDFAGGHIRNAVASAAFLAASAGTSITQKHLERAALEESRAMGRIHRRTVNEGKPTPA